MKGMLVWWLSVEFGNSEVAKSWGASKLAKVLETQ